MNLTAEEWLKIKGYLHELIRYKEFLALTGGNEEIQKSTVRQVNEIKGLLNQITK